MTIKELRQEISEALTCQSLKALELKGTDNPQTREVLKTAENMAEILHAVLSRIDGDRIALSFYK